MNFSITEPKVNRRTPHPNQVTSKEEIELGRIYIAHWSNRERSSLRFIEIPWSGNKRFYLAETKDWEGRISVERSDMAYLGLIPMEDGSWSKNHIVPFTESP